jgi:hypothetical protein
MTVRCQERARLLYRPLLAAKTTDPCNKVPLRRKFRRVLLGTCVAGIYHTNLPLKHEPPMKALFLGTLAASQKNVGKRKGGLRRAASLFAAQFVAFSSLVLVLALHPFAVFGYPRAKTSLITAPRHGSRATAREVR